MTKRKELNLSLAAIGEVSEKALAVTARDTKISTALLLRFGKIGDVRLVLERKMEERVRASRAGEGGKSFRGNRSMNNLETGG